MIVLGIVYFAVNGPAFYQRLKYKVKKDSFRQEENTISLEQSTLKENRLIIPKIKTNVPIIFLESDENKEIKKGLENGVIHWPDTAMPGEEGNCVITGHSSSPVWEKGRFKTVFALLDKLDKNDLIIVYFNQNKFTYKVTNKAIISSKNREILSQKTKKPTLTLYTCWPLGTDLKRLVVTTELFNGDQSVFEHSKRQSFYSFSKPIP